MDWVAELCERFQQACGGQAVAPVSFADKPGLLGELGREFNALAAALGPARARGLTRERTHALRNHLAGILAALYVLAENGTLSAAQQAQLRGVVEEARELDAALRAETR